MENARSFLATNIQQLRFQRNWTQAHLAEVAGLKRSTVAALESGSGNPTMESLIRLGQAFQLSIDELISPPRAECQLIRARDIPSDRRSRRGVTLRKLLPDPIRATEMDELILEPDSIMKGSPHTKGTKEYFACLQGRISVGVLGEIWHLEKGDVLSFPGDEPHSYKNPGSRQARGISVVLLPGPMG